MIKNDNLEIPLSPKDRIKGLKLPKKITADLAYLTGVLAGDGNIMIRNYKNDYRIKCVGNPKDEKEFYNKVIAPLFKKIFNLDIDVREQDSGTTYGFYIYSKALVIFFTEVMDLPKGPKYNKLRIPRIIKEANLVIPFIRGLADTDFCLTFKKKGTYPCITGSSNSRGFIKEVASELKNLRFKIYESYDYKLIDPRFRKGYSLINRIEINGSKNLNLWMNEIGFSSPKHLSKLRKK